MWAGAVGVWAVGVCVCVCVSPRKRPRNIHRQMTAPHASPCGSLCHCVCPGAVGVWAVGVCVCVCVPA